MSEIATTPTGDLSLNQLLSSEVLANPYRLYERLRAEDPVHWDPYLHTWLVTRHLDVSAVLTRLSAARTPQPEKLTMLGLGTLTPFAQVMVRQMLFLDPPEHARIRALFASAFTPRRVERMRSHIADIATDLLDQVGDRTEMDLMSNFADRLPAIVTAELLGLPSQDHVLLKTWSQDFAEMLGNFQYNPGRAQRLLTSLHDMLEYVRDAVRTQVRSGGSGLLRSLVTNQLGGDRLTEDEVVANLILTMVGGQETTTNLIGNGLLALLRHPEQLHRLRGDPALIPSAVEELLRYESPTQHTARIAAADMTLGGRLIRRGQAVIAVLGAANRDPAVFSEPERLDVGRQENRHLAFGWSAHFCFGARLARVEGQTAISTLLNRYPDLWLKPEELAWRPNLSLRGLSSLNLMLHR